MSDALRTFNFWLMGVERPETIRSAAEWEWYALAPPGTELLLVLAVLAAVAAGTIFLPSAGMPWRIRMILSVLRIAGFGLLAILLAQLESRVTVVRSLSPNIAVVTDTSGSMGLKDVGEQSRLKAAREFSEKLARSVEGKASIARYSLNWQLTKDDGQAEPGGQTRLMSGLEALLQKERNLQAVVLLTDGNDTRGDQGAAVAPRYAARGLPVFPVTFGRPDTKKMPRVRMAGGGDYVRLGDDLHLRAEFSAAAFHGQLVRARLLQEGSEKPIAPPREGILIGEEPIDISFSIKPDKPGRFTYKIVVDGIKGAATEKLLSAEHTVDVIDQRIRVLYIDVPRHERKVLGHWLARDPVIDLATLLLLPRQGWYGQGVLRHQNKGTGLPDQEDDLHQYDLIILGDIPRSYFREGDPGETKMQWLADFVKRRGGGLITLGGRSVYAAGNYHNSTISSILPFTLERTSEPQITKTFRTIPTPLGYSHPIMQLEWDFEGNRTAWLELPTLEGCNRVGSVRPGATLLAVRELEESEPNPTIAIQNVGKGKVLSLSIDTTWRWEMMRPIGSDEEGIPEGKDYFRIFWGNAVRYLSPDPRLEPERPQIARSADAALGQTITLITRLVDRVYKPLRRADLTVRVKSPSGKVVRIYPSDSRSRPGVYEYPVTLDEPGEWEVTAIHNEAEVMEAIAKAEAGLKKVQASKDKGAIARAKRLLEAAKSKIAKETIRAGESTSELEDARARPAAMESLAEMTGSKAFKPDHMNELIQALNLNSYSITQRLTISVWNLPAVMVLFIIIVGLDCFIRKRRGLV